MLRSRQSAQIINYWKRLAMLGIVAAMLGGAIYYYFNRYNNSDQPPQINQYIILKLGNHALLGQILNDFAKSQGMKADHDVSNFGGHRGSMHVYSLYGKGTMITIQSSIIGLCTESENQRASQEGFPEFSNHVFFMSIYQRTALPENPSLQTLADEVRAQLESRGGKVVAELKACVE